MRRNTVKRGRRRRAASILAVLVLLAAAMTTTGHLAVAADPAGGDAGVLNGVDLQRPRLLLRRSDLPGVVARLARQPYQTLLTRVVAAGSAADAIALDDHSIGAERSKARAAKSLSFLYAIDRTMISGQIVRFPPGSPNRMKKA